MALLPELRLVLLDPDRRRREAQLARRLGDEARTKLLEGLDEAIVLLRASGEGWDESTIERLAKELSPLTAKEIRERLVAADLAPEGLDREKKRRRADRAGLDPTTLRKIRENLEHLRLANLYEFLALGPQSSPQALLARAEEKYLESLGRPKADADARAVNALSGLAKQAFASDQQKARYDQSLGLEAMVQLKPRLEDAGRDGFLAREEVNALLELARRRGVATEDALAYIEDYAATRKWRMQTDSQPLPAEELQLCGYCRALTRPGAERCPGCGELLEQPCPRCGASNPTSAAACLNCGSKVGDGPLVAGLLQEGERLALGGELVAALEHFERGLRYWPEWPPLVQARERAQQRLKAREMELAEVENLVGATRLVAAERALERFSRLYGAAGTQRLRERIERGLALASEIFAQAESLRAAGANAERVRAQLDRTLRACSDFEPALQAAAEMPLAAPSELVAERLSTGLRLRWKSVSDKETSGVTYRVLRKRQGMPLGPQDGVLVASVAGPPVDDVQAEAGVPWCYAVYSERSGVLSRTAALSGPHLRLLEVEALEVEPGDRSVLLRWRAPTGCIRVEVERQLVPAGPASSAAPSLLTSTAESAQDTRLQNGKTYAYRVVAVYPDPARPGSELRAAAVTVVATPVAPPAPVLDLRAERDGNRLRLRWSKVAEAWVEIRLSTSPVGLAAGTAVPLTSTASWGERLSAAGGEALETRLPGPGRFWLIPLSVR
ncbi:MAG TPA: hypothetical protein PK413_09380, partial [Thermoanaerobaculia bacterium]|nr:hypothetical protein [Thermoanaerobaculia bacterium]